MSFEPERDGFGYVSVSVKKPKDGKEKALLFLELERKFCTLSVTLTSGVDALVGTSNNDVFNAQDLTVGANQVLSLGALDTVNGGAGNDTINIYDQTSAINVSGSNISNVETANVAGALAVTANTTNWTGLETLNLTQAGGTATLTAAATTDVNAAGNGDFLTDVNGGKNVTVSQSMNAAVDQITVDGAAGNVTVTATNSDDAAAGITLGANAVNAGTVTVNASSASFVAGQTNVDLEDIAVTGGTTITVAQTTDAANSSAATTAQATDAFTQGDVTVTGGNTTTTVNVTQQDQATAQAAGVASGSAQTQTVTFTALAAQNSVTVNGLTFTAAKNLTAAEVAQAFANLTSGDRQDDGGPVVNGTYTGVNTANTYTTGAANGATVVYTANVNLGGANNNGVGQAALTPTVAQNGGATAPTTPTAVVSNVGATNVAAVTGVVGVANGAVIIDDNGTKSITTVTVDGYAAGATLGGANATTSLDALTSLTLKNSGAGTATVRTGSTGDLALTLDDVDGTVNLDQGGATLTGLTINTEGTASANTVVTASAVTNVTINAAANLSLSNTSNLNSATAFDVNGAAAVTLNGIANNATLQTINASDNTGGVTVSLGANNAVAVTGGAGNDSLTLASTGIATGDSIAMGAGNDTVTLTNVSNASNIATGVTISGGAGDADVIGLSAANAASLSGNNAFEGKIDGFEILSLTQSTGTNTVNLDNLDDISYVRSANSVGQQTESGTYNFVALTDGQSLTVAGVKVQAIGGNLTDIQVAEAFDSAANGATPASVGNAYVTGSFNGWSTADNFGAATVVFTSSSANTDVADLDTTDSVAGLAAVNNVTASNNVDGGAGAETVDVVFATGLTAGQSYSILGLTVQAIQDLSASQVAAAFAAGTTSAGNYYVTGSLSTPTNWTGTPVLSAVGSTVTATNTVAGDVVTTLTEFDATGSTAVAAPSATGTQSNYTQGVAAASVLTLTNMANNGTVELNAAGQGVTVTMSDATGTADAFNVVLDDSVTATGIAAGTVTTTGVETINVSVDDTFTDTNNDGLDDTNAAHSLTLADATTTTVNVSGAGDLTLTAAGANVKTVDASAATGIFTYSATTANMTVTGGAGNDVISVTAAADNAKLFGGAGNDTFNIVGGADQVVIDGGAGTDTFVFTGVASTDSLYTVINNIGSGDTIQLNIANITSFNSTAVTLASGATESTQAYQDAAMASLSQNQATWFQYGGNTYIVADLDGDTTYTDAADFTVMLTGLVDLSTASFNTTIDTLEIA